MRTGAAAARCAESRPAYRLARDWGGAGLGHSCGGAGVRFIGVGEVVIVRLRSTGARVGPLPSVRASVAGLLRVSGARLVGLVGLRPRVMGLRSLRARGVELVGTDTRVGRLMDMSARMVSLFSPSPRAVGLRCGGGCFGGGCTVLLLLWWRCCRCCFRVWDEPCCGLLCRQQRTGGGEGVRVWVQALGRALGWVEEEWLIRARGKT